MIREIAAIRLATAGRPFAGFSESYIDALHDVKLRGEGKGPEWLKGQMREAGENGWIARRCALADVYWDSIRRGVIAANA
nr:hypothetical protein [Stenotrophomonas maltophilia]